MTRPISRTALVLDIVGAAVLFIVLVPASLAFFAGSGLGPFPEGFAIAAVIGAGALQCGAVAIGRLAPGVSLAVAWAGAVVQMASALPPLPINAAIFAVLFATAAWGSTRVFRAGLISVIGGGVLAALYIVFANGVGRQGFGLAATTATLLGVVSVLALGLSWVGGFLWRLVLRGRETREAQRIAEATAAEEQERMRIARDMHDIVAHSLAVVGAQADGARYALAADPDAAPAALSTIAQTARGALSDVRILLTQLRHRQAEGPQPTLADLEALFAQVRDAGVDLRVTIDPMPASDPPLAIQLAVYRILQEALTNALRHGGAPVEVHLSWYPTQLDLQIRNPLALSNPARAAQISAARAENSSASERSGGGHGIIGMRERAQLVGGVLRAEPEGGVFLVHARLPLNQEDA